MSKSENFSSWAIDLIFKINPYENSKKDAFNVIETFAGIGSQRKALSKIKDFEFEILAISEWEVYALISYVAIHHSFEYNNSSSNETQNKNIWDHVNQMPLEEKLMFLKEINLSIDGKEPIVKDAKDYERYFHKYSEEFISKLVFACIRTRNFGDVANLVKIDWNSLPKVHMLTYSFPCTDISNQGKQAGLFQSKRSSLLWSIQNFIKHYSNVITDKQNNQIDFLLMENVPEIFTKFSEEFSIWKDALERTGYLNWSSTLNGLDFNVAQARKRAFMVSCWKNTYPEFNSENFEIKIDSYKIDKHVEKPTVKKLIDKIEAYISSKPKMSENLYVYSHQYKSQKQLITSPSYSKTIEKIKFSDDQKRYRKENKIGWNSIESGWYEVEQTTRTFKEYISKYIDGKSWSDRSGYIFHEYGSFNSEYKIQLPWSPSSTLTATGALSRLKYYDPFSKSGGIKILGGPISYLLMGFEIEDSIKAASELKILFENKKTATQTKNDLNYEVSVWSDRNMRPLTNFPNKADELLRKQAGNSIIVDVIFAIIDIISKIWKNRQ